MAIESNQTNEQTQHVAEVIECKRTDEQISRGFNRGNYSNAYETTDYDTALAGLSPNRSTAYVVGFTLGFFASYDLNEMGLHDDTYLEAYHSEEGQRCVELGYIDERDWGSDDESEGPNDEWTRTGELDESGESSW